MLGYLLLSIDILQFIQDYGIIFTIFAIFIIVAYSMLNTSSKRIKTQDDKIASLYDRIDKMIEKNSDDNSVLKDKFMLFAENANKIQIQLYHLLQKFKADRVSIYEYHNGGKNLAGVEFKKCSNTYEAVSLETKPMIKEMQNLPLSLNPLWSKVLSSRDSIIIPDIELLDDGFLKTYLKDQNINTYYATILDDYDNRPIGFITMEYYHEPYELSKDFMNEFEEISIKISVLISKK